MLKPSSNPLEKQQLQMINLKSIQLLLQKLTLLATSSVISHYNTGHKMSYQVAFRKMKGGMTGIK